MRRILTLSFAFVLATISQAKDELGNTNNVSANDTEMQLTTAIATEETANGETPQSVAQDEAFLTPGITLQDMLTKRFQQRNPTESAAPAPEETATEKKRWKREELMSTPKFGGYIIGSYKYDDAKGMNKGDGFGLRLVRLYVDGTLMHDFKYRLQLEVNGTPHIKDATLEWVHWRGFQIKAGQFKRAFTFENPYNPWDVGTGDYSQIVKKLAGMGDRCGEASMGGRDLGLQLQGDLFKSRRDGHYQFHYQLAAYNGQGINQKDRDGKKDFIGTVQWSPVKNLWLGAFGWKGSWYSTDKKISVDRNRYAFGLKYESPETGWSARAEYARSFGYNPSDWDADTQSWKAEALAKNGGDKADAWYVTLGVPVWRWLKCYVKYDAYRDYATNSSMHSIYSFALNMQPHKNLMLQLQYNYNNDRTDAAPERHYNQLWAQMYVRF